MVNDKRVLPFTLLVHPPAIPIAMCLPPFLKIGLTLTSSQSAGKTPVLSDSEKSICQYRSNFASSFFQKTVRGLIRTRGFVDSEVAYKIFYLSYGT